MHSRTGILFHSGTDSANQTGLGTSKRVSVKVSVNNGNLCQTINDLEACWRFCDILLASALHMDNMDEELDEDTLQAISLSMQEVYARFFACVSVISS